MKVHAHSPTIAIDGQNWHAAMIAFVLLFLAAMLLLASQSGALLNNPLLEQGGTPPAIPPRVSVPHRISLDLHPPIRLREGYSIAHPIRASLALARGFSIGIDQQVVFKAFGDAALRDMMAQKEASPQLKPRDHRFFLMLMLLGLDKRHG